MELLIYLWPGDWRQQLNNLNKRIALDNRQKRKLIKPISEHEFWVFWGLILLARIEGRCGNLWDSGVAEGMERKVNVKCHMIEYRFKDIRSYIPYLFADTTRKGEDEWWQVSKGIDDFNLNRQNTIFSGLVKVFDESMSAYCPQTTKTGNLPHLSNIARKPEPLGTELKVTADSVTSIFIHLEIQRGKTSMAKSKYTNEMLKTAACSCRLGEKCVRSNDERNNNSKNIFLGDSWFSSVPLCVQMQQKLNSHYIGVVKTNHANYPKQFLLKTMSEWPAGSHLVLEATSDNVPLLAVGYKYNSRKVHCFVATKGAGHTEKGVSYMAGWKDENGNTLTQRVPRPEIVSKYYSRSNIIDKGNQARQSTLKLEKHWITTDGFFRLITTLFGICVTDCWRAYTHHISCNHRHKACNVLLYAAMLAKDCLYNDFSNVASNDQDLVIMNGASNNQQTTIPASVPAPAPVPITTSPPLEHRLVENQESIKHNVNEYVDGLKQTREGNRKGRGTCLTCSRRTKYYCLACPAGQNKRIRPWYCSTDCFNNHPNHHGHVN